MDILTVEQRSVRMSRIRGKDTKPEMVVRRLVHAMGFRYRLHGLYLSGRPDLVFGPRRKVVFVHGCFWHRHPGCRKSTMPKTRVDYWQAKFDANVARDARNVRDLEAAGWDVMTVWECKTKDVEALRYRLTAFLDGEC